MIISFHCPVCGSPFFTTVDMRSPMIRQCRGGYDPITRRYHRGCDYTWPSTRDVEHGLENLVDVQEVRS